jgi:flagellar export protein FliJ
MTTFHFRLQRVLEFRNTQFQLAESECHRSAARLRSIQAQQAALAARKSETRKAFANLPEVAGRDLMPLPDWYEWTEKAGNRLAQLERTAMEELQKHRDTLIAAQRKVRLLEKLREKRLAEWQEKFDREIEELAADSTNSRYSRLAANP